jgi:death-on-curing protein
VRYLTLSEVLEVHRQVMAQSGGAEGLIHLPALEYALAQPQMAFGGEELYPTLVDKAALGYALIKNYPFLDGNKRTGHAAIEVFLVLNGYEIRATVDEQEYVILRVVADACRSQGLSPTT